MNFYEVAVDNRGLKGHDTLTYSYEGEVPLGSVVRVEVRSKKYNGVVIDQPERVPAYKTKSISAIIEPAAIPEHLLKLARWIAVYYASDLATAIQLIIPRGVHKKRRETSNTNPAKKSISTLPDLTMQQQSALKRLAAADTTSILHGVTGSGKTRLYIELARRQRKQKRGSIILVPEIGLTQQIVNEFQTALPDVFVVHSQQTESVRHRQWQAILAAESPVVIGPRSALFSPIGNLGLIVVDEAHEPSYKQDQSPKYHANRIAAMLAKLGGARLVLGSATPSVEDYYMAKISGADIVRLDKPVNQDVHKLTTGVVDLRRKENFSEDSRLFSKELIDSIGQSLAGGGQVMLFHNRRGTSTSVICTNCGWLATCPRCHLPLTHHADWQKLVCHICNYREPILSSCPDCGLAELRYRGAGTKQIVAEAQKLFPKAKIARFDSDNLKDERLHERYEELRDGAIDIVVGTQGVAKGLDLPKLRTVGVVIADVALHLPDFSASERTFQLIYQVIGRVARHQDGNVIIQTYSPEHPAIVAALNRDYKSFYDYELAERQLTSYPPFAFLMRMEAVRKTESGARQAAEKLAANISKTPGIKLLGPAPSFYERTLEGGWRWQIVAKARRRQKLVDCAERLPQGWQFELDPINLL